MSSPPSPSGLAFANPFYEATVKAGAQAFTIYNHVYAH